MDEEVQGHETSPVLTREVMSFEEFDASIAVVNGRTVLTAREKAPFRQETLYLEDVGLQVLQEGGANYYEGEGLAGQVGLFVGLPSPTQIRALGVTMDEKSLLLARPGAPLYSHSTGVSRYACLFMPVEQFIESVDGFDPTQTERLMTGTEHLEISPATWRVLVSLVDRIMTAAASDNPFQSRAAQRAMAEELTSVFIGASATSFDSEMARGRREIPRQQVVSRVCELLESPSRHLESVATLARRAEVSERTLRTVVREHFGLPLKQLIACRQLREIRISLRDARPDETVSRIAARHGVWDWGRFAQRYKAVYGELPSTTLAAARPGGNSDKPHATG